MQTHIFHTVNSGLIISDSSTKLLIDGIHGCGLRFSYPPRELLEQYRNRTGLLRNLSAVLFTHEHEDHCDYYYLELLRRRAEQVDFFCPDIAESTIRFEPAGERLGRAQVGTFTVWALRTKHDGPKKFQTPNVSYLIENSEARIFIAGDSAFTPDDGAALAGFGPVDCAFFNTYQAASAEQREFIRGLRVRSAYIYHLPFPEDDDDNYIILARQLVRHFPQDIAKLQCAGPMEWIPMPCRKDTAKGGGQHV